jgi:WD40 repeat protein
VDGVAPQRALIDLRRALMVGAAAVLVAASWALAGGGQTSAEARAVVYGQQAFASRDGRTLAAGSRDGTVLSWDVQTDNQVGTALNGHAGPVSSVAFSPNGRTLATATENGTVQLWDVRSDTRIGTLKGLSGIVDSVAFSPSGRIVAAGGRDGVVLLWDVPSRSQLGTALKAHAGSVYSVAFSPDGRTLAAGSADGRGVVMGRANPRPAWDARRSRHQ